MSRELFGTDGIRGLAGEYPLDEDGARHVGSAVASVMRSDGKPIVIGRDTRESSSLIVSALKTGINDVSTDVVIAGIMPTPALAYLTRENDFAAGIMVTASHNPYQYNGIKVFGAAGDKVSDDTQSELNRLIELGSESTGLAKSEIDEKMLSSYEDFLVSSAGDLKLDGYKIAVDTANGSASGLAQRVFERLGAHVTPLFDKPDGRNINDHCGATDTSALQQTLLDKKLNLGIAVDGDADRLIILDEQGRELNGDHIMYLLAVQNQTMGVVATVMSNLGLELALKRNNITLTRTAVGDRNVLDGLRESGYTIGGEQSGHIIIYDLLKTGDALLGAVQVLKAVQQSGKSLSEWRDEVTMLPQSIVNIPLSSKELLKLPNIQSYIAKQEAELGEQGRMLVRPSGTEPLARVMVESPNAAIEAQRVADGLQELIMKAGGES